jgi:cobalamin synthase
MDDADTQRTPGALDRLAMALAFLSRLPMPGGAFQRHPEARLNSAADQFAVAGLVIALPAIIMILIASLIWPPA